MMKSFKMRLTPYLLIMILPLAVLLVRPMTPALVVLMGEEIQLSTAPVDPRDIFRGDYVALRFDIEQIPASLATSSLKEQLVNGNAPNKVYLSLAKDSSGIFQPRALDTKPPTGYFLSAKVTYPHWYKGHSNWEQKEFPLLKTIGLSLGNNLTRYYVKENTGHEVERLARQGNLIATVKLWRGRAVIESLRSAK